MAKESRVVEKKFRDEMKQTRELRERGDKLARESWRVPRNEVPDTGRKFLREIPH